MKHRWAKIIKEINAEKSTQWMLSLFDETGQMRLQEWATAADAEGAARYWIEGAKTQRI